MISILNAALCHSTHCILVVYRISCRCAFMLDLLQWIALQSTVCHLIIKLSPCSDLVWQMNPTAVHAQCCGSSTGHAKAPEPNYSFRLKVLTMKWITILCTMQCILHSAVGNLESLLLDARLVLFQLFLLVLLLFDQVPLLAVSICTLKCITLSTSVVLHFSSLHCFAWQCISGQRAMIARSGGLPNNCTWLTSFEITPLQCEHCHILQGIYNWNEISGTFLTCLFILEPRTLWIIIEIIATKSLQ